MPSRLPNGLGGSRVDTTPQPGHDFFDRTLAPTRAADRPGLLFGRWAKSRRLDDPGSTEQEDSRERDGDFGHKQEQREDNDDH